MRVLEPNLKAFGGAERGFLGAVKANKEERDIEHACGS